MNEIIENLHITKGTVNQLTDLPNESTVSELIEYLEELSPDATILYDLNIEPLIRTIAYNDLTLATSLMRMNNNPHGMYIDFYYYTNLDIYVMETGER